MWHDYSEVVHSSGPAPGEGTGDRTAAEVASQFFTPAIIQNEHSNTNSPDKDGQTLPDFKESTNKHQGREDWLSESLQETCTEHPLDKAQVC